MKLSQKQRIFTRNIGCLIEYAYQEGIELTLGEAHRTESQGLLNFFGYDVVKNGIGLLDLVKRKRTSWTTHSLHLSRMAVDFNFFIGGDLTYRKEDIQILGDYWESLHLKNRWGGNFEKTLDTPHFEMQL